MYAVTTAITAMIAQEQRKIMAQDLANLHSRWDALFRGMGTVQVRHHEFDQLVRHYREPHRGCWPDQASRS